MSYRVRLRLEGIVQGVGFRPFVHSLATRIGVAGFAANDSLGLIVEAEGEQGTVTRFTDLLVSQAPRLASIERIGTEAIPPRGERGFSIVGSDASGLRRTPISPDIATCEDCLAEIFDRCDRRYAYPFNNCTNCGPRFTIVRQVPYDRPFTTMAEFAMCDDCAREYGDIEDRRYHAQPISCPACGPRLTLVDATGLAQGGDPLEGTAILLRAGAVVAIKGLGGYHLAALASDEEAVARLRARKRREDKPFAVMVANTAAAHRLAEIDAEEKAMLESPARPIVLVRRRNHARLAPSVVRGNRSLGLMLPYTPLHHLLARRLDEAFVLTSGNVSDEPIAYRDGEARTRLAGIASHFLLHDREIHTRMDDSVVRGFRGRELPLRRSRGFAPRPLALGRAGGPQVLACGAELKSTFCLARGGRAYLSHHIGDLENFETLTAFVEGIAHFRRLFDVDPAVVAHDLHPEYLSTKYALDCDGVERVAVQHHHAHIAACLADNGEEGPAIGVALDGLGFGTDGTLWGGEFLVADLCGYRRAGHLEPVPLLGGTQAIRQPWRLALAYLHAAYGDSIPTDLDVAGRNRARWAAVAKLHRSTAHAPLTSSAGRLFDAVAAVLGVRDEISYEGQAAIELEQLADLDEGGAYPARIRREAETWRLCGADFVASVVDDLRRGTAAEIAAARFHNGLAASVTDMCEEIRADCGLTTVALSGGVFQNVLLLERAVALLKERGFRVLTHSRVPPNDGGISFGQAAIALARH